MLTEDLLSFFLPVATKKFEMYLKFKLNNLTFHLWKIENSLQITMFLKKSEMYHPGNSICFYSYIYS